VDESANIAIMILGELEVGPLMSETDSCGRSVSRSGVDKFSRRGEGDASSSNQRDGSWEIPSE
jgi:hypothetical protein